MREPEGCCKVDVLSGGGDCSGSLLARFGTFGFGSEGLAKKGGGASRSSNGGGAPPWGMLGPASFSK